MTTATSRGRDEHERRFRQERLPTPQQRNHGDAPGFNIDCDSLAPAGTPFVRGINCRVVEVDGYPRQYIVYLPHTPAFDPAKETPVVFHFHGKGEPGARRARTSA